MNHIKRFLLIFSALSLVLFSYSSSAEEDEYNYDYILKELSQSTASSSNYRSPFATVNIHMGVAYATTHISLENNNQSISGFMQGAEAHLGIDLFSKNWLAEGTVRSFSNNELKIGNASLKEFDLKIVHRSYLNRFLKLRSGIGVAARYLDYTDEKGIETRHTTPSGVFLIGFDALMSKAITVGTHVSYRKALISETADKSAFDAALRVSTHF